MAGSGERRRPEDFVDREAEESGDDIADDEEGDDAEDGGDLDGFIASDHQVEAEQAAADQGGADEDSSSDDLENQELDEEDLAVLEEAGLDTSQVKRRRPESSVPGTADSEPSRRRQRTEGGDDASEVPVPASRGGEMQGFPDKWDGLSEGESVDDFVVEDTSKRRRMDGLSGELDITGEQREEIIDIFGDLSVLMPIDELAAPTEEPLFAPQTETVEETVLAVPGAPVDYGGDPDLRDKLYETEEDMVLERVDLPERWVQVYHKHKELLDRSGNRQWTDEEHECEAQWIYMEAFWSKNAYEREPTQDNIVKVLKLIHFRRLEPIHVVRQYSWQFLKRLTPEDIWLIAEYDQQWQSVWLMYSRVTDLLHKAEEADVPDSVRARVHKKVFENKGAELDIKDAYDWFVTVHPELVIKEGSAMLKTSESRKMKAVRRSKFDEKLGITVSIETMSLKAFGITPNEFGANVELDRQINKPSTGDDEDYVKEVCKEHINEDFKTWEAVREAIVMYLARLIASEPRVRRYVRQQFNEMCAVSTTVTELGRAAAYEAAQSFKPSYRAFHLVNRPIDAFPPGDPLFLDCLNLERKGLIQVHWNLIIPKSKQIDAKDLAEKDKYAYKLVLPGHDAEKIGSVRMGLSTYEEQMRNGIVPSDEATELMQYKFCQQLRPRLEATARAHEIMGRRLAATSPQDQAQVLFKCAKVNLKLDHLTPFLVHDPIYDHLCKLYCSVEKMSEQEVFVVPNEWNQMRQKIMLRALRDELYPLFWSEVQAKLSKEAEREVCRLCRASLTRLIDVQPFRLSAAELQNMKDERITRLQGGNMIAGVEDVEDEDWNIEKLHREKGIFSVLVIVPEIGSENVVLAVVNPHGDPVDMRVIFKNFYQPPQERDATLDPTSFEYLRLQKRIEHNDVFRKTLIRHTPAVVMILVGDKSVKRMKDAIEELCREKSIADEFVMRPKIIFGNPTVPRVVAYHERLKDSGAYRDLPNPQYRMALSAARFIQDPLSETCQLWHERHAENGVLSLNLHRLQHALPRDRLASALMVPIQETLAKSGLHVNRLRRSQHLCSTAAFAPGLGPRKARLFQKCLEDMALSRAEVAARMVRHMKVPPVVLRDPTMSTVVQNILPFLLIRPDARDDQSLADRIPGLDNTRLGAPFVPWIRCVCREGVKAVRDLVNDDKLWAGDDYVKQALECQKRGHNMEKVLQEVDLSDWPTMAGEDISDDADLDTLLGEYVLDEITECYRDQRQAFEELDDDTAFYLQVNETEESMRPGALVHATVLMDKEYPEVPMGEPKAEVVVEVIPSMVRGTFRKREKLTLESDCIPGCDRAFKQGENILARVSQVSASRNLIYVSVDMDLDVFVKSFPVVEELDAVYFVPFEGENWTKKKLGLCDGQAVAKVRQDKEWVTRPRNIRHTNWANVDHDMALQIIDSVPLNNVIFRPSRRYDCIIAMLKVRETHGENWCDPLKCFRSFNIFEKGSKTATEGFEISKILEVDGYVYNDLDEIIARHMDPISENLRLMQEHPRFGVRGGEITSKPLVKEALASFTAQDPRMLYYSFVMHEEFVGHCQILWALGGHHVREDLIEVQPSGFRLWNESFMSIKALLQWFKTVGWRNAERCRKEFKIAWEMRKQEAQDRRGVSVRGDEETTTVFGGWDARTSLSAGLQTPTMAAPTPTMYGMESAAATPGGLMTPSRVPGSPAPPFMPGTPADIGTLPATPAGAFAPSTPFGVGRPAGGQGRPAAGAVPMTPQGLGRPGFLPSTPAGAFSAARTPAGLAPATPAFFPASRTPAGFAPSTPANLPSTPAAAFGGLRTPGGVVPMTPGVSAVPSGFSGGSRTPMGPPPFTPARPVPMTPGSAIPSTPRAIIPSTPAGAVPQTPGFFQPQTPRV
eukprot:TRINITY_DN28813_c0_g1_i1.p1 TRINITY_DN28813_c0_g1~~TRINITY_DN28813_c0_g1_i1.p1  ORF type:complete len:1906 (-),score=338.66 TRINITY_DN28813_c0_g1_i1:99-5756(-)